MRPLADLYDVYHRRIGYRLCEAALGRSTFALLAQMQRIDTLPTAERTRALAVRLATTLNAAAQVPFYRNGLADKASGVRAGDAVDALKALPITRKEHIRDNPRAFLRETCRRRLQTTRTAGSTGQPLVAYCDPLAAVCGCAAMAYGRSWWGLPPGARSVNLWGHSKYLSGGWRNRVRLAKRRLLDAVMNRTVFPAYDLSASNLDRFADLVLRKQPVYLVGYASALHAAACAMRNAEPASRLRAVVSTGEVLYEEQQQDIEEYLRVPVVQEYGLCEAGVIAYSCPAGSMHVLDPLVHVELLDDEGRPVDVGETGRIVVSLLGRHDVVILRYDTGDLATEVPQGCACGRPGRRIGRVAGRAYDLIRTPSGGAVPGVLFTHAMKYLSGVQRYCVVQTDLDRIEVRYEQHQPLQPAEFDAARRKMIDAVGSDVQIRFQRVDALPRESSGKFRWIRSELTTTQGYGPNRNTQ